MRSRGTNGLLVAHFDASDQIFGYNIDQMVNKRQEQKLSIRTKSMCNWVRTSGSKQNNETSPQRLPYVFLNNF